MLYVQLKSRAVLSPGAPCRLCDVAEVLSAGARVNTGLTIPFPNTQGVWKLPAITVVRALQGVGEDVSMMGAQECIVHIVPPGKRKSTRPLRAALAFALLLCGSTLAVAWFHADVNMAQAQSDIYRMLTGGSVADPLLITLPYTVGVGAGVALFYALIGKRGTVSPLDVKLSDYRSSSEQVAAKAP